MQVDNLGSESTLLLRPPQAARTLAISERKLWELTQKNQIRCVRIGRAVRYAVEDLRAFIESQSQGGEQ